MCISNSISTIWGLQTKCNRSVLDDGEQVREIPTARCQCRRLTSPCWYSITTLTHAVAADRDIVQGTRPVASRLSRQRVRHYLQSSRLDSLQHLHTGQETVACPRADDDDICCSSRPCLMTSQTHRYTHLGCCHRPQIIHSVTVT